MLAADDRKVSDRIQDEQKRTGQMEKVPHHEIGRPGLFKFGKTVENIESVISFFLDQIVNIHGEGFKAVRKVDADNAQSFPFRKDRLMFCEAYIDEIAVIFDRLLRKSFGDRPEFIK